MTGYVVQTATFAGTFTSGTVTLPGSTRAGNTLIALASVHNVTSNGSVSAVTLGGVADNFGQVNTFGGTTTAARLFWWLDPLCAGGQTQVAFTSAGGVGNQALSLAVLEVGGMIPLTATPAQAVDISTFGTSSANPFNSGTAVTSFAPEIYAAMVSYTGSVTATTAGDPQYPWVNLPVVTGGSVATTTVFSYQLTPTSGNAIYAGTVNSSGNVLGIAGLTTFPCIAAAPVLPDYMAGAGVQQGDAWSLYTSPLGFAQQRTVLRAAQLNTTTTLAAGPGTQLSVVGYDTVLEDPYQGWSASTFQWTPPFSGVYLITFSVSVGTVSTDAIVMASGGGLGGNINGGLPDCGLVMPVAGGVVQGQRYVSGVAGQGAFQVTWSHNSPSQVTTSNSPGSTVEITWLGFAVAGA